MAKKRASIWTPANVVTVVRVTLVPVWLAIAEAARIGGDAMPAWITFFLYVAISLTDKLDGWLARSRGEVTTFGKFLDPIADKLAVIVALLFLLEEDVVASWVVFVVVARELLVDGLRMVSSSQGVVIAASSLGKWKTATTMVAICALLFAFAAGMGNLPQAATMTIGPVASAGQVLLLVAVALTVWSGLDYLVKCWPTISEGA